MIAPPLVVLVGLLALVGKKVINEKRDLNRVVPDPPVKELEKPSSYLVPLDW
jgi:xanthosine utilization system XapX-like protein